MTYAKYPECNIFVDTKMWNLLIQIHIDGNYIHSIICPFVLLEIVYSAPSKDPLGGAPITVIMMSWANFAHTLLFGSNRIPKRSEFQSEGATPEWEWTALHAQSVYTGLEHCVGRAAVDDNNSTIKSTIIYLSGASNVTLVCMLLSFWIFNVFMLTKIHWRASA